MAGGRVLLLLTVALLGATALANPLGNSVNETDLDDEYVEDALGNWLGKFGVYTFMVEHDVDDSDMGTINEQVLDESPAFEEEEEEEEEEEDGRLEEEDYDQESSAPIALTIRKPGGLLNPEVDYKVKIESLVAETGTVLVTLESYNNKTFCGVGGFTLPPESHIRDGSENRLNISHQQEGNRSTTIVAFAVNTLEEENATTAGDERSAWEELGHNLWWASGKLAGGGIIHLTYTPPECGCLMLRAHYALPVGDNLTLVVGPEAYPLDLEKLLCVDPTTHSIQENLIEPEEHENGTINALRTAAHEQESTGDVDSPDNAMKNHRNGRGQGRWAARQAARKAARLYRKKRRQETRQAIRQAGRRVTRRRVRNQMRLQRQQQNATLEEPENRQANPNGRQGGRWARKKARKAAKKQAKQAKKAWKNKKPWKKHRKHARKGNHRNKHHRRNKHNRHQNITDGMTTNFTDYVEHHLEEEDHHLNATEPQTEEDEVADLILSEEDDEDEEAAAAAAGDDAVSRRPDNTTWRRGRKHRRQGGARAKNKWRNKERRKGVKFCCKRGIKHKKAHLQKNDTTEGDQPEFMCHTTDDIVTTYAGHQFGIGNTQCQFKFEKCCTRFTMELWDKIRAKKAARMAKRQQQRKSRRQQQRKHRRNQRFHSTSTTASVTQ